MERAVALKKLSRMLGKNVGYRVSASAPTREEREAAAAQAKPAREARDRASELVEARYKWLLENDAEYQRLKAAKGAAQEVVNKIHDTLRHRKITVGVANGMFNVIQAEGDSWEEIFEILEKKKVEGRVR
jgi:hypothetical protein